MCPPCWWVCPLCIVNRTLFRLAEHFSVKMTSLDDIYASNLLLSSPPSPLSSLPSPLYPLSSLPPFPPFPPPHFTGMWLCVRTLPLCPTLTQTSPKLSPIASPTYLRGQRSYLGVLMGPLFEPPPMPPQRIVKRRPRTPDSSKWCDGLLFPLEQSFP